MCEEMATPLLANNNETSEEKCQSFKEICIVEKCCDSYLEKDQTHPIETCSFLEPAIKTVSAAVRESDDTAMCLPFMQETAPISGQVFTTNGDRNSATAGITISTTPKSPASTKKWLYFWLGKCLYCSYSRIIIC
mmetsp:Transcript_6180/g.9026  ORF Transcript_6180/g.9026 Transcript_6180/m.9026 type:complete len:135 (+) Transcript_6180:896-1300(+)